MKLYASILFFALSIYAYSTEVTQLIEHGSIGVGFSAILAFILQQFKRLLEQQADVQTRVIEVVEKNTYAHGELKQAFEKLNARLTQ